MVTTQDVQKFQVAYLARFGIALELFDARTKLELLVSLVAITYQPITKNQLQSINENENSNGKTITAKCK